MVGNLISHLVYYFQFVNHFTIRQSHVGGRLHSFGNDNFQFLSDNSSLHCLWIIQAGGISKLFSISIVVQRYSL